MIDKPAVAEKFAMGSLVRVVRPHQNMSDQAIVMSYTEAGGLVLSCIVDARPQLIEFHPALVEPWVEE